MNIINRKKQIAIFLLIFIEIFAIIFFNIKSFEEKTAKKDTKSTNILENKNKMFAIMLETEKGTANYLESNLTSWPTDGYVYNKQSSGCVDGNNNILTGVLEYDEENHTAIVNTDTTTYCYLYFDIANSEEV